MKQQGPELLLAQAPAVSCTSHIGLSYVKSKLSLCKGSTYTLPHGRHLEAPH